VQRFGGVEVAGEAPTNNLRQLRMVSGVRPADNNRESVSAEFPVERPRREGAAVRSGQLVKVNPKCAGQGQHREVARLNHASGLDFPQG
jgi:hypothetical protein